MKLYYSSATCALSPLISMLESGAQHEVVNVNLKTRTLDDGTDYRTINPFGFVPMLELEDGRRLGEGVAIIQYIADQVPAKNLAPQNGKFERYELQGRLNFIATDLVKNFDILFMRSANDEVKQAAVSALNKNYAWVDDILSRQSFFYGDEFTIADAYLFTVTGWDRMVKLDLSEFKNLQAYRNRIAERPAVIAALARENAKAA